MDLAVIVAQSTNRVIGINNELPWSLPADMAYFRAMTKGKPIIMGRKTFESIGRVLPGRVNIVITGNPDYSFAGLEVVSGLSEAIALAKAVCEKQGLSEAMVIGGSQIYQQALKVADKLYVTQVDVEIDGDAFFPPIDGSRYSELSREDNPADDKNKYPYSFVTWVKIAND